MKPDVWTIKDVIRWSTDYLSKVQPDSPRLDVELLLADVLAFQRIELYTKFDQPLSSGERDRFKQALRRRMAGEPVAYILGHKEFYGLDFKVTPVVLIPRPDTEHLVEQCLRWMPESDSSGTRVLDIGTGSGCIAITLKVLRPHCYVEAWEVEDAALGLAAENARHHQVEVCWRHCDARASDVWQSDEAHRFDLICSNPPYIAASEKSQLSSSVLDYEPHTALFAQNDGMLFYRIFAENASKLLQDHGRLLVEFGYQQAEAVKAVFQECGWRELEVVKDLAGHDRVLIAVKP